jgi:multidrug transporter EmrE-like cation transporter
MASSVTTIPRLAAPHSRKPVYMVLGCTVFAAAAQVLMKFGANHAMPQMNPGDPATWMPFVTALLANYQLVLGYVVQSGNALLLILALRDGELSMLYPIIALTYVWVNLLSMYFFHDQMNFWKGLGIALVIGGVALLGRASTRA